MAGPLPGVPTNFMAQPGNGSTYLSWSPVPGATSYNILRSTDSVTFSQILNQIGTTYADSTGTIGTLYYYEIQSVNANGTSNATAFIASTPVNYGKTTLGALRLAAQQRANMEVSDFVTTQEWNDYISKSYQELYDILVQIYADEYYVATPYSFVTTAVIPALYALPSNFYKLLGVDLALGTNRWLTLKKFSFSDRNRYIYGNAATNATGVSQPRYRLIGNNIEFASGISANQTIQLWFIPRPSVLLADSDQLDGVNGWEEYIIVDVAIKALQKEESDVSVFMAQKQALISRIESVASNRDAGEAECASDVRGLNSYYGGGLDGFNGDW